MNKQVPEGDATLSPFLTGLLYKDVSTYSKTDPWTLVSGRCRVLISGVRPVDKSPWNLIVPLLIFVLILLGFW